jgi:hypothetical protein
VPPTDPDSTTELAFFVDTFAGQLRANGILGPDERVLAGAALFQFSPRTAVLAVPVLAIVAALLVAFGAGLGLVVAIPVFALAVYALLTRRFVVLVTPTRVVSSSWMASPVPHALTWNRAFARPLSGGLRGTPPRMDLPPEIAAYVGQRHGHVRKGEAARFTFALAATPPAVD